MKKILKSKKILALILLIITLFSQSAPVFAASGSGNWAGGQFASFIKTTDNADTKYGVLLRYLINISTKEKRTVFCAENGIDFNSSVSYNGIYYTPIDSKIRKACKIAYLGWYKEMGDYVVVINAAKVAVTGSKKTDKMYYHHTGYVGGLKSFTFEKKIERHPEDPIMLAVKGMLPKGPLGRKLLSNLKVFAGAEHTHAAQNPQSLEV